MLFSNKKNQNKIFKIANESKKLICRFVHKTKKMIFQSLLPEIHTTKHDNNGYILQC